MIWHLAGHHAHDSNRQDLASSAAKKATAEPIRERHRANFTDERGMGLVAA